MLLLRDFLLRNGDVQQSAQYGKQAVQRTDRSELAACNTLGFGFYRPVCCTVVAKSTGNQTLYIGRSVSIAGPPRLRHEFELLIGKSQCDQHIAAPYLRYRRYYKTQGRHDQAPRPRAPPTFIPPRHARQRRRRRQGDGKEKIRNRGTSSPTGVRPAKILNYHHHYCFRPSRSAAAAER